MSKPLFSRLWIQISISDTGYRLHSETLSKRNTLSNAIHDQIRLMPQCFIDMAFNRYNITLFKTLMLPDHNPVFINKIGSRHANYPILPSRLHIFINHRSVRYIHIFYECVRVFWVFIQANSNHFKPFLFMGLVELFH